MYTYVKHERLFEFACRWSAHVPVCERLPALSVENQDQPCSVSTPPRHIHCTYIRVDSCKQFGLKSVRRLDLVFSVLSRFCFVCTCMYITRTAVRNSALRCVIHMLSYQPLSRLLSRLLSRSHRVQRCTAAVCLYECRSVRLLSHLQAVCLSALGRVDRYQCFPSSESL